MKRMVATLAAAGTVLVRDVDHRERIDASPGPEGTASALHPGAADMARRASGNAPVVTWPAMHTGLLP